MWVQGCRIDNQRPSSDGENTMRKLLARCVETLPRKVQGLRFYLEQRKFGYLFFIKLCKMRS